jgi:hypothetical protein
VCLVKANMVIAPLSRTALVLLQPGQVISGRIGNASPPSSLLGPGKARPRNGLDGFSYLDESRRVGTEAELADRPARPLRSVAVSAACSSPTMSSAHAGDRRSRGYTASPSAHALPRMAAIFTGEWRPSSPELSGR